MRTVRYFKALFGLLLFASVASAQSAKQYMAIGDEALKRGEYYNAAEYYKQGLEKYEYNLDLKYKYAEALRGFNDYKAAAEIYQQITTEDVSKLYPLATFYFGSMLHYLGKYDQAIAQFKKFTNRYHGHDYYLDKAQQEIASCSWAKDHLAETDSIKIVHLPEGVNSPYSETNPFQSPTGKFLFSALRNISENKKKEKYLARIYTADSTYANTVIQPLSAIAPEKHIANGCYNSTKDKFYFTLCDAEGENKALLHCELYYQKLGKGDSVVATVKLNSDINLAGYTATQPSVGKDANGNETLYYISDRPGGYGKTDIWMSKIKNDSVYETPTNIGAVVNSIDEEFSPYYDSRVGKLYFASNWHYGFGGLDIFETKWENGQWTAPKNLGHAINSAQNDFYFYQSYDRSTNYLASNRKGALYLKSETCCNDIWMYHTGERVVVADTPLIATVESKKDSVPTIATTHTIIDTPQRERVYIDRTIKKMKQLLPVTLYFHNDEPECCNLRDTTPLNYVATYQAYWQLLTKYKSEYGHGLSASQKTAAEQEVFMLFTDKVERGYHDLIQFSGQLLDILQSGQKIEITIQGYCSPLNYNAYNIQLGYRRIASLRNYFYHYRGGILAPYIQVGKLVLKNESMGEEKANKAVSDKLEDTRNSVYNPNAAIERKVEIISVELK